MKRDENFSEFQMHLQSMARSKLWRQIRRLKKRKRKREQQQQQQQQQQGRETG